MRSGSWYCLLLFSFALCCAFPDAGIAEDILVADSVLPSAFEEEAPTSLFSAELDGEEAELLIRGSWDFSLLSGLALTYEEGKGLAMGDLQPILFMQRPDLFLSFLLFESIFVEARVSEDLSQARYAAGIRGEKGSSLKELRIGNDGISFPALPFVSFGEGSRKSFGFAASGANGPFEGRAMLRYDQAEQVVKRFVGGNEIEESILSPLSFTRGRYFVTPSVPAIDVELYAESQSGTLIASDDTRFRRLESGEFSYSAITGSIELSRIAETRIAAKYTGLAPTDFSIEGADCALLYDPLVRGSGTERLSRYPAATTMVSEAFIRDRASGARDDAFAARLDPAGFVEVSVAAAPGSRDPLSLKPFAASMPWIYTEDPGTGIERIDFGPAYTKELVMRSLLAKSEIAIDADYVPGTVQVRRNGAPDYAFVVDDAKRTVVLANPPGLAEEIEVAWLKESAERKTGSLAAGLATIYAPNPEFSMWAALAARWSLPGASYASSGSSNPGTLLFAAGESGQSRKGGALKHRLSVAGRWTTEEASGRYRIEGMESSGRYVTSFRPEGAFSAGFYAKETAETELAKLFPAYDSAVHSDGTAQRALSVRAGENGIVPPLVKYIEAPPYAALGTFSFFARGDSQASLEVAFDDGAGTALSIRLPEGALGGSWRRFIFRYGRGETFVEALESESGVPYAVLGASAEFDSSRYAASRLSVRVAGASPGDIIWLDELALEESVGSAAMLAESELTLSLPDFGIAIGNIPIIKGFEAKVDGSGAAHADSFASGGLSARTNIGPIAVTAKLRGRTIETGLALRGGHEVALALGGFPVMAKDVFDLDPATKAFGLENGIGLDLPGWFALAASQTSAWSPGRLTGENGLLIQDWSASAGFFSFISAEASAKNRARPLTAPILGKDYFDSWIAAFPYILPASEDSSFIREVKASFILKTPLIGSDGQSRSSAKNPSEAKASSGSSLDASLASAESGLAGSGSNGAASLDKERSDSSRLGGSDLFKLVAELAEEPGKPGLKRNSLAGRIGLPLKPFRWLRFDPYYHRLWTERRDRASFGLVEAVVTSGSELLAVEPFISPSFFAELWSPDAFSAFESFVKAESATRSEAAYKPEIGFRVARDYGSSWVDLVLPSIVSAAYRREMQKMGDALSDSAVWEGGFSFLAINVFGSIGAYPLTPLFESDEYISSYSGLVKQVAGEKAARIAFLAQHLGSFYERDPGSSFGSSSSFVYENRFSFLVEPSRTDWSENLRLSLALRQERSWLLDLYLLALGAAQTSSLFAPPAATLKAGEVKAPAKVVAPEEKARGKIVSAYIDDLRKNVPWPKTIIELITEISQSLTDAKAPAPSIKLTESWEAKLTAPKRLTVSVKTTLSESFDGLTKVFSFGATLSLGLTLSF